MKNTTLSPSGHLFKVIKYSFFSLITALIFSVGGFVVFAGRESDNNPPVANGDSYSGVAARYQAAPGVLANDFDPDGDPITAGCPVIAYPIEVSPQHGSITLNSDGSFGYAPTVGYTGDDSFTYNVCDSAALHTSATVTLIKPNSAPDGGGDSYSGTAARYQPAPGLLGNDSDPNGDPIQVGYGIYTPMMAVQPQHGTVSLYSDGSFGYSPSVGYTGDDSFTYNSCDNLGACTPTAVNLIKPNSAPDGGGDSYSGNAARYQPAPGLLGNDSDPNGDPIQVGYGIYTPTLAVQPQHGTVSLNADGSFNYAPTIHYTGSDSFSYNACDSLGGCTPTVVDLIRPNSAPVGGSDYYLVTGSVYRAAPGLLGNDSDPNNDPIQVGYGVNDPPTIAVQAQHGYASLNYDGSFGYTAQTGYAGYDYFIYNVCDNFATCDDTPVDLYVYAADGAENAGATCSLQSVGNPVESVGKPVNVTNGNMWTGQTDYRLPGIGENIEINRTYNSIRQTGGLFGFGWSSNYDESIWSYDDKMIRLNMPDGKAVYFGRRTTTEPFTSLSSEVFGSTVKNTDNTYTLTFKDGRVHQFNAGGRLLWQQDRDGNRTTLNYDTNGNLAGITDAFNRTLIVTSNADGTVAGISDSIGTAATYEYYPGTTLLKTVTYADGSKYKFEYDSTTVSGKVFLKTVKDALDNVLETHSYDTNGRATTSEKAGGVEKYTLDYAHINDGVPYTTVTDALGRVTKYTSDKSRGRNVITQVEGNCGCGSGSQTTVYQYDEQLNLVKKVDALGREMSYTYDGNGNRLTMTDVLGTEIYTYNGFGEVLTRTDRMNGVTTNNYNPTGNLLTTTDALNKTTTLTYTPRGQLATVKDARNKTTTLGYDTVGRLTQVTDANNNATVYGYDARVRVTSMTNALNETMTYQYDLNNRPKKVIHPDTKFEEFTYDPAGRRTKMKDGRGNDTTYGYDAAYRLISVTDALNHTTTTGYDLMSNRISQTDALGNTTNYEYDDFDRLTKMIYPPAATGATRLEERMEYDAVGNVKKRIDTANRETLYDYDTAYRLQKTTDALSQMTQFEYNARRQMTKVTDAASQQYVFTYDALGRQLSQTRAGTTMSYQYDAVGNRTKRTDYTGRVTDYTFDNLNRLSQITYNTATPIVYTYTYNALSQMLTAVNPDTTLTYTYDNVNRQSSVLESYSGNILRYVFDGDNNRTQLKLNKTVHANYAYDAANRLTTLTDEANQNFTFGYDAADRMTSRTMPNGVATAYSYDGMSRLTELKHQSATATLTDNNFTYNGANQISQIAQLAQTKNFTYDAVDRLTQATNGTTASENYNFDAVGNRTSSHLSASYGYQPFNKLVSTATGTYGYDANGNLISKTGATGSWTYTWDYENRMTSATNGTNTVTYTYDALGRRIRRTQGASVTKFVYDGMDVIRDDASGIITRYQNGSGVDNKLKAIANGGQPDYFLQDHLGSTVGLTNQSGNLTSSASYDSFGNSTNNLTTRYQYTGREYDSFTGLNYYRARWYDANLGRFTNEDPIGFEGNNIGLYSYVNNNPVRWKDSLGLKNDEGDLGNSTYYSAFDWERIRQADAERKMEAERRSTLNKCLCELQQQIDSDAKAYLKMMFEGDEYKKLKLWNSTRATNVATAVPGMFTGGLTVMGAIAAGVVTNEAGGYVIPPISDGLTDGKFMFDSRMAAHYNFLDRNRECYKKADLPFSTVPPFRFGLFGSQED